jgi:hypothetical protein
MRRLTINSAGEQRRGRNEGGRRDVRRQLPARPVPRVVRLPTGS